MHVVFIEPAFPQNQSEFVRGLHAVGARVTGIGEAPGRALPAAIRGWLHGYEQISTVASRPAVLEAVQKIQEREPVDRLEATVEAHVMVAAHVREACGIPGTSTKTAFLCRDKPAMKQVLREADVPCAASIGASSAEDVHAFVEEHGYPVILKPRDAAGAAGTHRADDDEQLEGIIREVGVDQGMPTAVEEFIEGHEAFYDTVCIDGHVVHDFVSHYYPNVLEAMRARWISPQIVITNRNHTRWSEALGQEFGSEILMIDDDAGSVDLIVDRSFQDRSMVAGFLQTVVVPNNKSPGETALYWDERKILFLGDALIGNPHGKLSLLPPEMYADVVLAREGIRVLLDLDFEYVLVGDVEPILSNGKEAIETYHLSSEDE